MVVLTSYCGADSLEMVAVAGSLELETRLVASPFLLRGRSDVDVETLVVLVDGDEAGHAGFRELGGDGWGAITVTGGVRGAIGNVGIGAVAWILGDGGLGLAPCGWSRRRFRDVCESAAGASVAATRLNVLVRTPLGRDRERELTFWKYLHGILDLYDGFVGGSTVAPHPYARG